MELCYRETERYSETPGRLGEVETKGEGKEKGRGGTMEKQGKREKEREEEENKGRMNDNVR